MDPTIKAYLAAGFRDESAMLEHARCYSDTVYLNLRRALAEAAENSTAMVVVPGEPPGKNLTGLIRNLVADRTKLIVVTQPGRLAPGNFERLLRASMPDAEKKLRIMDGGASIVDAVNSAERNRHYRPSQALEVYADPQLAAGFSQAVSDGSLGFDPTVIQVHPTEIPTDDVDALLKAVTGDDLDAMHRTMDPHVFSDQDALRTYKEVLGAGLGESVVREFLTDIAPSRDLGIQTLDAILRHELGDEFADLEYLGSGRNGSAYRTPDGLILKVTTDPAEADSARKLVGVECEYIHRVHAVEQVGEQVWLLVQEELDSLPSQYAEEFDLAMEILETIGAGHALRAGDAEGIKEVMMECGHPDLCVLVAEVMRKFDVGGMLREVAELGLSGDFHSGNVKLREGRPVLTDLGTPGDDPNDISEAQRFKKARQPVNYYPNNGQFSYSNEGDRPCPHCGTMIGLQQEYPRNARQAERDWDLCPECGGELGWTRGEHLDQVKGVRADKASPMAAKWRRQKGLPANGGKVNELSGVQAAPQAGPPANMRGSNSSAWAAGKAVLSKPTQHVPEDENANERDNALDQDIVGGGLDWGTGLSKRGY